MSDNIVSLHAAEKYAERIMGIVPPEGKVFPMKKLEAIQGLILRILTECHPNAIDIGEGTFTCKQYDCKFCLQEGVVTTTKGYDRTESKRFRGGIMKSGKKAKKQKTSDIGPRERTGKKTREKWWEKDWDTNP